MDVTPEKKKKIWPHPQKRIQLKHLNTNKQKKHLYFYPRYKMETTETTHTSHFSPSTFETLQTREDALVD